MVLHTAGNYRAGTLIEIDLMNRAVSFLLSRIGVERLSVSTLLNRIGAVWRAASPLLIRIAVSLAFSVSSFSTRAVSRARTILPRGLRIFPTLLALSLSLAACVAGPNFSAPHVPDVARYTKEPLPDVALATRTPPSVTTAWWQVFHSSMLDDTVRTALAGNQSLQAAQASLTQARAIYGASRSVRFPTVAGTAGIGRNKIGAAMLGGLKVPPFTYYSVGADVSYLLDFAGGKRRSIEQQLALTEVKAHELQAAHLSLTGNVVLQALAIASARAQIQAAEAVIADDNKNVALVRTALQAGSVARIDLLSAESQLAQDQTLLPPLRQELSIARHALAVLAGRPPGNWSPPNFDLADFAPPAKLPSRLPSELAHRRPDILAAEAQLHAATAAVGVAAARLYPHISITSSLSQQALTTNALFDHDSTAWSLASGLTAPLFAAGKLRSERDAAKAGMQGALADYEQTVLAAFGQVADVLTALQHDAEQKAAEEHALDVAEQNRMLTRMSYAAGNVGVLQVLDAERLVERARIGAAQASARRMQAIAELIVALGGDTPRA